MTTKYAIFYNELFNISPEYASFIIQEFTSKGFAKEDQIMQTLSIDRIAAKPYYYGRYYERLMDQAVANKERDELSERSTIIADESAKWAKKSSDADDRSANTAGKTNKIAIVAIVVSVISLSIVVHLQFNLSLDCFSNGRPVMSSLSNYKESTLEEFSKNHKSSSLSNLH